jgi:hypothetical protein
VFYVYLLRSESDSGFNIGFSTSLRARLRQHQDGESFATKSRGSWKLIYYEAYTEQEDAEGRGVIKSGSGGHQIGVSVQILTESGDRRFRQFRLMRTAFEPSP